MLKKAFLSGVLLVFIFLASGCGTIYQGARGVKTGAKEDWAWLAKSIGASDSWFKDNLW
jgi:hypothetical protein